jgi:hypothetical protein
MAKVVFIGICSRRKFSRNYSGGRIMPQSKRPAVSENKKRRTPTDD